MTFIREDESVRGFWFFPAFMYGFMAAVGLWKLRHRAPVATAERVPAGPPSHG